LHVVYVPVVTKEIKYTKRAGAELAGKVKEVITQINHTDKWPRIKVGRGYINEYSKLQDRFYEHMKAADFDGFERGERGSSAEHLDVLDYKIQQDNLRLDVLDERVEKKEAKLERLDEKITVREKAKATIAEVDAMGKPTLLGNGYTVTNDEMKKLKSLAKKSVTLDERIAMTKKKMAAVEEQLTDVKRQLDEAKQEAHHWYQELTYLKNEVKDYLRLAAKFPARVREFFSVLFREEQAQEQQQREAERQTQLAERLQRKKTYEIGR
jgi:chromosome segregation ATPase